MTVPPSPFAAGPAAVPSPQRVVVIGAGLAGLCAGYELARLGHDVTILEARDRVGGRVHTVRAFDDGLYAEAGAMFVPGSHALTVGYARHLGLTLVPIPTANPLMMLYVGGARIDNPYASLAGCPIPLTPDEAAGGLAGLWKRYLLGALPAVGDPRAPGWPDAAAARFDDVSLAEYLRAQGASEGAVACLGAGYLDLWGEGIGHTSALLLLRDLASQFMGVPPHLPGLADSVVTASDEQPPGDRALNYRVQGGNDRFPAAFAATAELAGRIRLGRPVRRIEAAGQGLAVFAGPEYGPERLVADHVICTVPFPVLRDVDLAVPVSDAKRRAIATLRTTAVTRTWVQVRTRFWAAAGLAGSAATDLTATWASESSVAEPGTRGILEGYAAGAGARAWEALDATERVAAALAELEVVFPGAREQFERGTSFSWSEERWSRGGYCWFAPGEMRALLPALATPEAGGRLHFAGDHTSALPAWMEGAIESGLRAVGEVA